MSVGGGVTVGRERAWVRSLVWVVVSLATLVGAWWGAMWVWDRFLAWWTLADTFAHFNVAMLLAGVVIATIARACGASWGWTIALAIGLPLVVVGAVLWWAARNVSASSRIFDDG